MIRIPCALLAAWLACAALPATRASEPLFFADDPLVREVESQDASGVRPWQIAELHDIYLNLVRDPGRSPRGTPAANVNTIDEVADSSWFTNRLGRLPLTPEDVARGPNESDGPAPGDWVVSAGKNDGIAPGFEITDARGDRWILKFDPLGHKGMTSSAEVITTKLLWALGYHVPENHVVALDPSRLTLAHDAMVRPLGAKRRTMREGDIAEILEAASRDAHGAYRVMASRFLPGTPLGGFRFHGTRPDDPNDVVPHEDRRELRGLRVFAAWLNHAEARSSNTLDTLVREHGRGVVRHHLLDFGSTLGSGTLGPRPRWLGHEKLWDGGDVLRRLFAFGFPIAEWRFADFHESDVVGRIEARPDDFRPDDWKPRISNAAFERARHDDKAWAARKLAHVTDEMIRAAVTAADVPDPAAAGVLVESLRARRDRILAAYLRAGSALDGFALDEAGTLTFESMAVVTGIGAPPSAYVATWSLLNNSTGRLVPLGESAGETARLQAPARLPLGAGDLVQLEITAAWSAPAAGTAPVRVVFRRQTGRWQLVGVTRTPDVKIS
jgi:hypothetical protein